MTADLKVVSLQQEGYKDAVVALKEIIREIESGEIGPVEIGFLMVKTATGDIDSFGFGPRSDSLQVLGLIRCGEQIVIESLIYPEPV